MNTYMRTKDTISNVITRLKRIDVEYSDDGKTIGEAISLLIILQDILENQQSNTIEHHQNLPIYAVEHHQNLPI